MLMPTVLMACPKSGCYARNVSVVDLELTYTDTAGTSHSQVKFGPRSSIDNIKPGTKVTVFYNGGPTSFLGPPTSLTFDAGCDTISAAPTRDKLHMHHVNWCEK